MSDIDLSYLATDPALMARYKRANAGRNRQSFPASKPRKTATQGARGALLSGGGGKEAAGVPANTPADPAYQRLRAKEWTLKITLPLPPKECSPNARAHWTKKAKAVKGYRAVVHAEVLRLGLYGCNWPGADVAIYWYHRTAQWPDCDNIIGWLKSGIDGLVDGQLISDDRNVNYPEVHRDTDRLQPRVVLHLRPSTVKPKEAA